MAVQASPQSIQTSIPPDAYAIDAPSSRRQYIPTTPHFDEPRSTGSPSSNKRPSKRPSNGSTQYNSPISPITPQQAQFSSAPNSAYASTSSTARPLPSFPASHASPVSPTYASSNHQSSSRRQRSEGERVASGPPINPPPRISSNQRAGVTAPADGILVDRTRQSTEAHQQYSSPGYAPQEEPTSAGRTRRREASSQDPSQYVQDPRESRMQTHQNDQAQQQSRVNPNARTSSRPDHPNREQSEVISRMVVTDPQVDVARERERVKESIPDAGLNPEAAALAASASATAVAAQEEAARTQTRRQDFSSTASKRKETKFGEYILGQTLGEGEFGKVKLGWKKDGSVQVAIKLMRRENLNSNPSRLPKMYREINILRGLAHPNIVRLHEMVETERQIGIILEYASGGELFDYILTQRYLKDGSARRLFAQLISGVGYLHKKGIVHRDLKLENLLLDRNRNIIITDFGFANTFDPRDELSEDIEFNLTNKDFVKQMDLDRLRNGVRRGDLMQTSCGSPCYAAPELVVTDSLYTGRKVDVWSCGVILYAMLAGYLPFDDDPANPEGDNINLLYKYIVSTPLTFPEWITPHARDLLRRILVPDPRKRADLFEVARHSWLAEFAHVVAHVTSSTTTLVNIANTTVGTGMMDYQHHLDSTNVVRAIESQEAPQLARSASVREPTKVHASNIAPVGGLVHQGKIDPEQQERVKSPRDNNRRTIQVEYVAPQSSTSRGEASPPVTSPTQMSTQPKVSSSTRSGSQGVADVAQNTPTTASRKPLPQDPPIIQDARQYQQTQSPSGAVRIQQRPVTSGMAPPARPARDVPRSVSDSTGAFASYPSTSSNRPQTGGSMSSIAVGGRLPSRGNSYSQPLAPTVAATNAQGRLAQPTPPKMARQYNISAPIPHPEPYISDPSTQRPTSQRIPTKPSQVPTQEAKSHKRSTTLGSVFGRTGSIFGAGSGKPQTQSPTESSPTPTKKYPPTSMKNPITNENTPRPSSDSRRPSLNFLRKSSDLSRQEKSSRRFSLLPASFSLKNFGGSSKQSSYDQYSLPPQTSGSNLSFGGNAYRNVSGGSQNPGDDRYAPSSVARGSTQPTTPLQHQSKHPQYDEYTQQEQHAVTQHPTTAPLPISSQQYHHQHSQSTQLPTSRSLPINHQSYFVNPSSTVPADPTQSETSLNYAQNSYNTYNNANSNYNPSSRTPQQHQQYDYSTSSLQQTQARPRYPPGFNSHDEDIASHENPTATSRTGGNNNHSNTFGRPSISQSNMNTTSTGGGNKGRVLQKPNRKFGDGYETDGAHGGSSGAAKRVMDFFRRRGRARAGTGSGNGNGGATVG